MFRRHDDSLRGFTIVELLIVIVVIGILAAISLVAYSNIQARARDTSRSNAVASIQKALEAYKVQHGVYPPHTPIGTNAPTGFNGVWGNSYSYSVATNNTWISGLVTSNTIPSVPKDPTNDNEHYFTYWSSTSYGKCTEP